MKNFALLFCAYGLYLNYSNALNAFNSSALDYCESVFFNCTNYSLPPHNNYNFSLCAESFDSCLYNQAFLEANKTLECFLAESAWKNLDSSYWFAIGSFLFSNIGWPIVLKATANTIMYLAKIDQTEHPYMRSVGEFLLKFNDTNHDGDLVATELALPQAFITFASASLPIIPLISANDAQARCDYTMRLSRHN